MADDDLRVVLPDEPSEPVAGLVLKNWTSVEVRGGEIGPVWPEGDADG